MAQDIVVALMGVMAAAAVAVCWWYEHHGSMRPRYLFESCGHLSC